MTDIKLEVEKRVQFIKDALAQAGARGIVFGNSGGKDSALVGILCKMACDDTLAVMMPCFSKRNFGEDLEDADALAKQFAIETITVDLTGTRAALLAAIEPFGGVSDSAVINVAPRLRMTTLYAIAQTRGALVAGTGNADEAFMGYFTKWGDGAYDLNPIADLHVSEIYAMLRYLNAPQSIIGKAPSAGLYDGQTDEGDMGVRYAAVERYMKGEPVTDGERAVIERMHGRSEHKRRPSLRYGG